MTELEKVVKGLECCTPWDGPALCNQCPYDKFDSPCGIAVVMRDALALLKEQVPRVLTLDDVCGGGECWIEYKYGGCGYADVYLSDHHDGTAQVYRCRPVGDTKPETVWLNDYGKFWRGWTSRPSAEMMANTPWEGEAE